MPCNNLSTLKFVSIKNDVICWKMKWNVPLYHLIKSLQKRVNIHTKYIHTYYTKNQISR